jgi:hypothetical protein
MYLRVNNWVPAMCRSLAAAVEAGLTVREGATTLVRRRTSRKMLWIGVEEFDADRGSELNCEPIDTLDATWRR